MFNKYRLTAVGVFWLWTLRITNVAMVAALVLVLASGLYDVAAANSAAASRAFLQLMGARLWAVVSLWSTLAVLLAVLVWSNSGRMTEAEARQWEEAMRGR